MYILQDVKSEGQIKLMNDQTEALFKVKIYNIWQAIALVDCPKIWDCMLWCGKWMN
jgi:hypothetical protein